jgi:hypothetical protein
LEVADVSLEKVRFQVLFAHLILASWIANASVDSTSYFKGMMMGMFFA